MSAEMSAERSAGRIVVGVDGSANADVALQYAVEEGRRRGVPVDVVLAWHEPYTGGATLVPIAFDPIEFESSYQAQLDKILQQVADVSDVEIRGRLVRGTAATALLDAAADADLLVVGNRGHGGFTGLLIGSTSQQVVWHAPCPVVVVPAADTP